MKKLVQVSLAIAALGCLSSGHQANLKTAHCDACKIANECAEDKLSDQQFLAKIAENAAQGKTCAELAADANDSAPGMVAGKADVSGKVVPVSVLVQRALQDQRRLLEARQVSLERWAPVDQAHFVNWFGTNSDDARQLIAKRINTLILLNQEYSVGNFRKAVPSKPGLFAFVHPNDPSKIFVDREFVFGSFLGANSRAGTICHEMSHFTLAGGTKDIIYGVNNCRRLARLSPPHALSNADSFEFYMEGVR